MARWEGEGATIAEAAYLVDLLDGEAAVEVLLVGEHQEARPRQLLGGKTEARAFFGAGLSDGHFWATFPSHRRPGKSVTSPGVRQTRRTIPGEGGGNIQTVSWVGQNPTLLRE